MNSADFVLRLRAAWTRGTQALRIRRLSTRIVALFLGLLLLVQLASFTAIRAGIDRNARAAVADQLVVGERVFHRLLADNTQKLIEGSTLLAADYGFRAAVSSGDTDTIASALENHGLRIGASTVAVLDTRFALRAVAHDEQSVAPVIAQLTARLTPQQQASVITMRSGRPFQFVMVPMKAPVVVGWVVMGFAIDQGFVDDVHALADLDVALLVRPDLGAPWLSAVSSLAVDNAVQLADLGMPQASLTLGNTEYGTRTLPLARTAHGAEVAAVLLQSVDAVVAPYRELQVVLAGLTGLGLLAFALGSVFTARHVTTPLRQLVQAAEQMGEGDYDTPVSSVHRNDEIGDLAQAFDRMRVRIAGHQQEMQRLAYWDTLTTLPNRAQFGERVREAVAQAQSSGGSVAVLMLDLDRFKHVNDVLGYRFGDLLLQAVAERLRNTCVRDCDVIARLSGDEFAVMLPDADATLALAVAQRIEQSFEKPIVLEEQPIDMGAGLGVACWPAHAADAETLVSRAEIAMYAAKRRHDGPMVYASAIDSSSAQTLSLLTELRHAMEHGELRLYLQPKVALDSARVAGAEALMRWQHPQRGLVPPMEFIPFAEQTGFIRSLTMWMFQEAARTWSALQHEGMPMRISINLSTRDLLDPELPQKFDVLLQRYRVPAEAFCLEITESAIMDDPQRAQATLERLSTCGFKLSIDDFGTGYSSLAYLKRLPVDELKIDKSFVMAMERDLQDAKIVRSTIDLAHNLGLTVVAEGVENAAIMNALRDLSCDEAQGYHMAKPMPAADFMLWCNGWTAQRVAPNTAKAALMLH